MDSSETYTASRRAFKLFAVFFFLAILYQLPFLLSFSTPTAQIFGRWSLKFAVFLGAYVMLVAACGIACWRALEISGMEHRALMRRIERIGWGWIGLAVAMAAAGIAAACGIETVLYGNVVFSDYVTWLIVLIVIAEIMLYLLLPANAYGMRWTERIHARLVSVQRRAMLHWLVWAASIAAALVPVAVMVRDTLMIGEGSAGNDQLIWIPVISEVLGGEYQWDGFVNDVHYQSHVLIIPGLIQIADAALLRWNQEALIVFGMVVTATSVWLLSDITARVGSALPRWITIPLFSALLFLPTHLATFSFGFPATQSTVTNAGVVVGAWALARFGRTWRGVALMCLGGLVAAWSSGNGLLALPCLFAGLVLIGDQTIGHYAALIGSGIVSALPLIGRTGAARVLETPRIREAIAWSFYHFGWPYDHAAMVAAGIIGLGLAISIVAVGLASVVDAELRRRWLRRAAPGAVLLFFGLGSIILITIFRGLLATWYTTNFMMLWVGLAVTACSLWCNEVSVGEKHLSRVVDSFSQIWSLTAVVVIGVLAVTHRTIPPEIPGGDSIWLWGRSPAAAACWRNYRSAPTMCQWLIGFAPPESNESWRTLARYLEHYQLTNFTPNQRWTLQGDYALNHVAVHGDASGIRWVEGRSAEREGSWRDYRHLNVMVSEASEVRWTVAIPEEARDAQLHTAAASGGVVLIEAQDKAITVGEQSGNGWLAIDAELHEYGGQTITVVFQGGGVYRYPVIDVQLDASVAREPSSVIQPSNTDLSADFPTLGERDLALDITRPSTVDRLPPNWELSATPPILLYEASDLEVCASAYSHVIFEIAVPKDIEQRAIFVFYREAGMGWESLPVPLLHDSEAHYYSIDVRLLNVTTIEGLQVWLMGVDDSSRIAFTDLRMAANGEAARCN